MMTAKEKVERYGLGIENNVTRNIVCPFCSEDWQNQKRPVEWKPKRSMSVTRQDNAVLYHCFRASCKRGHGIIHILSSDRYRSSNASGFEPKTFTPRPYRYRLEPATEWDFAVRPPPISTHDMTMQHVKYSPDRDTIAYPIFDFSGKEVGIVDRSYTGREPKAMTYWFEDVPKVHFPLVQRPTRTCVVVEDIPSAIKAAHYMSAAALLGSSISVSVMNELRAHFSRLIIMLDKDATDKAVDIAQVYNIFFEDGVKVIPLERDLKDIGPAEIRALLFSRGVVSDTV